MEVFMADDVIISWPNYQAQCEFELIVHGEQIQIIIIICQVFMTESSDL